MAKQLQKGGASDDKAGSSRHSQIGEDPDKAQDSRTVPFFGIAGIAGAAVVTFGIAAATVILAGPGKRLFDPKGNRFASASHSDQVLQSARRNVATLEQTKQDAVATAASCIRDFLTAETWSEAQSYLVGAPQELIGANVRSTIADATPEDITFFGAERQPGSSEFVVKHLLKPSDSRPPAVVWVENTPGGAKIRWDFLEQQLSRRLERFQSSDDPQPTRFFARLQLVPDAVNPFLNESEFIDHEVVIISSAFSNVETEPIYAVVPHHSDAYPALQQFFATSSSFEGWITASRQNANSGINYIIINALEKPRRSEFEIASRQKRPVSLPYGNSGLPR